MRRFLTIAFSPAVFCFFLNGMAPTGIYTLSLHDALPIWLRVDRRLRGDFTVYRDGHTALGIADDLRGPYRDALVVDRKSTRLNSSHSQISYAVFCLKKKIDVRLINEALLDSSEAVFAGIG